MPIQRLVPDDRVRVAKHRTENVSLGECLKAVVRIVRGCSGLVIRFFWTQLLSPQFVEYEPDLRDDWGSRCFDVVAVRQCVGGSTRRRIECRAWAAQEGGVAGKGTQRGGSIEQ